MFKNLCIFLFSIIALTACKNTTNTKNFSFKEGHFKSYLENKKDSSTFYRVDNLQIETYKNKIDTFEIEWKNRFEFHLKKQKPKTKLDSTLFIVKITKVKDNSYEFVANYLDSNFKQKGSTFKLNNK